MRKIVIPLSVLGFVMVVGIGAFLFSGGPDDGSASPSDLVGSWSGGQGAELTLREDGSLTAVKVPTSFSVEDDTPIKPFTGKGSWKLKEKPRSGDQEIDVALGDVSGPRTGIQLVIAGKGAHDGLYIPVSEDSWKKFTFKKSS
ncbi:hypothetical protein ACFY2W_33000 [Streptomyces sp. NPDC001262]|uniref:hypothetical protein n=1 Tax=Streptomyces sp. NPDC001262 TaxID=3364552 RepID=UPI0036C76004